MDDLIKKIRKISIYFWALVIIIIVGIFLRTYHFSDWLKFNSDQARDASVVRSMIEENKIPLLGPVAGGTLFKLGPAFYYFQYLSARVFGVSPNTMAYPDLFFGILAIPLLYLLARQYFEKNISLILTALYAIASFTVQYSRFAWNPNSAQFFDMLFVYSVLKLWNSLERKKMPWIILIGISLGISMQLHTLLLFGMPFASLILAIYLFKNKRIKFSGMVLIALIVLILNNTQIVSEIKTGRGNYLDFKNALVYKSDDQNSLWKNALFIASCQVQSNAKILAPYANQESCDFPLADKYLKRLERRNDGFVDWFLYVAKIIAVVIFSGVSYFFIYKKIKKDKEKNGKYIILVLFSLSLLSVFVPFGAEVSLRYFILLIFIPFILLGLWLEFLLSQNMVATKFLAWMTMSILIGYNLFFCLLTFRTYATNIPSNMIDGTMNQAKEIAEYIVSEAGSYKRIQLDGQSVYLGRFVGRIKYFLSDAKIEIIMLNEGIERDKNLPIFVAVNESSENFYVGMSYKKYGEVEKFHRIYDVTILKIKNDPK
ncbi:MAG: glycosyltransferase family 39 protein [bacterium]|nr:glycosyltransferase family 39 protein [bacterium]